MFGDMRSEISVYQMHAFGIQNHHAGMSAVNFYNLETEGLFLPFHVKQFLNWNTLPRAYR